MSPRICKLNSDDLKLAFKAIPWVVQGKVSKVVGNILEATLPECSLGTIAKVEINSRHDTVLAEVVGFRDGVVLLMPYSHLEGCSPGCLVTIVRSYTHIPVGEFLLGGIYDAFMSPLGSDHVRPIPVGHESFPLDASPPDPMSRSRITEPLSLGVRAIDAALTLGKGQRIGIMAGSGVGKSVLMGMMARNSDADINVIALIGERGREVREFIERDLGPEGLKRSVIVSVTSDQSPLMRIRGAKAATAIAEYFSQKGKSVLFMLDSLTRVAMAQREIGNSVGEHPTSKGYTPSVFSLLPKLLERTGPQRPGHGTISGLYTVLVDGDDFNDPIADAARSILDGHINLSRDLAAKGHFPAIDICTSASRVMNDIVPRDHIEIAQVLKRLVSEYQQNFDLVQIGAYAPGSNPVLDNAIALMPLIERFLTQNTHEKSDLDLALNQLVATLQGQDPLNITDPTASEANQ